MGMGEEIRGTKIYLFERKKYEVYGSKILSLSLSTLIEKELKKNTNVHSN